MSTPATPPRPGSWLSPTAPGSTVPSPGSAGPELPSADALATSLQGLPVGEHADVLTAEHDRLHRLLATIDQL